MKKEKIKGKLNLINQIEFYTIKGSTVGDRQMT